MCECIRNYLMNYFVKNLFRLDKWKHQVMPIPKTRLDKKVQLSGQWLPTWSTSDIWKVDHPYNGLQF